MRKALNLILKVSLIAVMSFVIVAADQIDESDTKTNNTGITSFYAFQGANTENLVLVANLQNLLEPSATSNFDEDTLVEFNIDNNADNVEDLVIQAIRRGDKMYFFGPVEPITPGVSSAVLVGSFLGSTAISKISDDLPKIGTDGKGVSMFAGPRDNPFFFDFTQFEEILAGNTTEFRNPGKDAFAGTNVLSVIIELPKTLLSPPEDGALNIWVETKTKQS